ncbi:hypothetical protein ONZ45_g18368 [Pleurotus djamor]|nr:hypothetical protein ONZ45_g18368 [Pleurotus djamor]
MVAKSMSTSFTQEKESPHAWVTPEVAAILQKYQTPYSQQTSGMEKMAIAAQSAAELRSSGLPAVQNGDLETLCFAWLNDNPPSVGIDGSSTTYQGVDLQKAPVGRTTRWSEVTVFNRLDKELYTELLAEAKEAFPLKQQFGQRMKKLDELMAARCKPEQRKLYQDTAADWNANGVSEEDKFFVTKPGDLKDRYKNYASRATNKLRVSILTLIGFPLQSYKAGKKYEVTAVDPDGIVGRMDGNTQGTFLQAFEEVIQRMYDSDGLKTVPADEEEEEDPTWAKLIEEKGKPPRLSEEPIPSNPPSIPLRNLARTYINQTWRYEHKTAASAPYTSFLNKPKEYLLDKYRVWDEFEEEYWALRDPSSLKTNLLLKWMKHWKRLQDTEGVGLSFITAKRPIVAPVLDEGKGKETSKGKDMEYKEVDSDDPRDDTIFDDERSTIFCSEWWAWWKGMQPVWQCLRTPRRLDGVG